MAQTKRARVEKPELARKKQRPYKAKLSASNAALRAVPIDDLPWKEVALPERLEDAEGFFGLEEIEDVNIIRDAESGNIQYRMASDVADQSKTDGDPGQAPEEFNGDGSEWTGFEDDAVASEQPEAKPKGQTKVAKTEEKKKEMKKDTKWRDGSDCATDFTSGNPFDLLQNATSGDLLDVLHDPDEELGDISAWGDLKLSSLTLSSLAKLKFEKPTPIQSAAIPQIRDGHDVIGKASTGSGKTLAFGIPILEYFISITAGENEDIQDVRGRRRPPVAMVLSPTRELAHQLATHLGELCSKIPNMSPRIATLTGGLSLHKQQRMLNTADIIIGTPGRLWEVIGSTAGILKWLRQIKFLVVDEADRLLSQGNFKEVEEILNSLDREDVEEDASVRDADSLIPPKPERQTLVFSATFQKDLQRKLAGKVRPASDGVLSAQQSMDYLLKKLTFRTPKPKFIDVNPQSQMASKLREGLVECGALEKDLYLYALLLHHPSIRTLIFTNSIAAVRRLAPFLQNLQLPVHALHSQMAQKARLRSLERFGATADAGQILVATDVASRGLDIPDVQLVLHYHAPRAASDYVHRSGRTARADAAGATIMLCAPDEVVPVRRLVARIHARKQDASTAAGAGGLRTLDLDRRLVARLKGRVTLAKKIADAVLAKEKTNTDDNWLKTAAEELGVEYDEEEFAASGGSGGKGRGQGRMKKMREAGSMGKEEVRALKEELKGELGKRINVGVSERYLTAGGVDVDALLGGEVSPFLGMIRGVGLD